MLQALRRAMAACATMLLVAAFAFAQSDNSTISGIVKDSSGAVIVNAKVTVTNEGTGFERQATTNETGFYTVPNIPPGYYTVTVEAGRLQEVHHDPQQARGCAASGRQRRPARSAQLTESVNVEASVAQLEHRVGHGRQDDRTGADSEPRAERPQPAVPRRAEARRAPRLADERLQLRSRLRRPHHQRRPQRRIR